MITTTTTTTKAEFPGTAAWEIFVKSNLKMSAGASTAMSICSKLFNMYCVHTNNCCSHPITENIVEKMKSTVNNVF